MPMPTTLRPFAALTRSLLPLLPACESGTDDPGAASPATGNGDPNRTPTWGKPRAPPLSVRWLGRALGGIRRWVARGRRRGGQRRGRLG